MPIESSPFEGEIEDAKLRISESVKWLSSQNYRVNSKISVSRSIADGIIEEANTGGYSFIIMMKRKIRGRFQKLFHKSITEEVIRYAGCMVLTFLIDEKRSIKI